MLLAATHHYIPDLVETFDITTSLQLLPTFAHLGCCVMADEAIPKAAMEATHRILDRAGDQQNKQTAELDDEPPATSNPGLWLSVQLETACDTTMAIMLPHIIRDNTDAVMLKRILAILRTICLACCREEFVERILTCLTQKTSSMTFSNASASFEDRNQLIRQLTRAGQHADISDAVDSSDSDGDDGQRNAGSTRVDVASDSDSSSDWDSSDDEEDESNNVELFSEFVVDLAAICKLNGLGFGTIVAALPGPVRTATEQLLT